MLFYQQESVVRFLYPVEKSDSPVAYTLYKSKFCIRRRQCVHKLCNARVSPDIKN